jgi:hypothetical protein
MRSSINSKLFSFHLNFENCTQCRLVLWYVTHNQERVTTLASPILFQNGLFYLNLISRQTGYITLLEHLRDFALISRILGFESLTACVLFTCFLLMLLVIVNVTFIAVSDFDFWKLKHFEYWSLHTWCLIFFLRYKVLKKEEALELWKITVLLNQRIYH